MVHLPCRHCHTGGYPSQVDSVGTAVRAPKSLKCNLHEERSDIFRMVRASSLELWLKPKRQFLLQGPATSLGQVSSEVPREFRHQETPTTSSSPGGIRDTALPSGNPYEWHVQMRNVATTDQEDDLEHTGQPYLSHSQRQPEHLNGVGAQARGT